MITREQRVAALGATVTLNGEPAVIGGILRDFATVSQKATGLSAQWSWEAVMHIITNKEGKFQS